MNVHPRRTASHLGHDSAWDPRLGAHTGSSTHAPSIESGTLVPYANASTSDSSKVTRRAPTSSCATVPRSARSRTDHEFSCEDRVGWLNTTGSTHR